MSRKPMIHPATATNETNYSNLDVTTGDTLCPLPRVERVLRLRSLAPLAERRETKCSHGGENQQTNDESDGKSDESSSDGSEVALRLELLGEKLVVVGESDNVATAVDRVGAGVAPRGRVGEKVRLEVGGEGVEVGVERVTAPQGVVVETELSRAVAETETDCEDKARQNAVLETDTLMTTHHRDRFRPRWLGARRRPPKRSRQCPEGKACRTERVQSC